MTPRILACLLLACAALSAHAHEHQLTVTVRDGYRYFKSNGIPDHATGQFPNRGNPNRVSPQDYTFRVTMTPQSTDRNRASRGYLFGIALSGVPFDPGTAELWDFDRSSGWNYEALSGKINLGLDDHNAHVQPTGAYHYHGMPIGVIEKRSNAKQMTLVGFAADGFPIYNQYAFGAADDAQSAVREMKSSYRIRKGTRNSGPGGRYDGTFVQDYEYVTGTGDLDECNGRIGVTPEYPDGIYYYCITEDYPFIPRHFHGEPDSSFRKHFGGGPPRRGGRRPRR